MDANNTPTDAIVRFTDGDLRLFKKWNGSYHPTVAKLPMIAKEKALLARLEEAERALWEADIAFKLLEKDIAYLPHLLDTDDNPRQRFREHHQKWREIAGKPE